jgi:beta-glucanase (GH16 family)
MVPHKLPSIVQVAHAHDPAWRLVWSDEFKGPNGSRPDPAKWSYDIGGDGWGNNELEYYTNRPENVVIQDGCLVISARREEYKGVDGVSRHYTSGRLHTLKTFAQTYGRFEARIKVPAGQGMWPAFWMLGQNINQNVNWPDCGEIDIMENLGREPTMVHGTIHGPGYSGGDSIGGSYTLSDPLRFSDDFHTFAVEWRPNSIEFLVDGHAYETFTPQNLPPGKKWVFDHPFGVLLNLAVGGYWPGEPDDTTQLPQRMQVDYVRVYAPVDAPRHVSRAADSTAAFSP